MNPFVDLLSQIVIPINGDFDPASDVEVATAEIRLGIKFPPMLRGIQTRFGRCMFSGEAYVSGWDNSFGIFTLFGCKGALGNLVSDFEARPDLMADGMVPFADDYFNNRFVWRPGVGDVLFIDYSNGQSPSKISESLEDFFGKIELISD